MTKKEREKLEPIVNAADNMAQKMERIINSDKRFDADEKVDITALKGMTAAMKELVAIIRNVNELPSKVDREAAKLAKEKFELDKRKGENDSTDNEVHVVIEGAERWSD